jgi:hypothetical protein
VEKEVDQNVDKARLLLYIHVNQKMISMKNEIRNLADDLELKGTKRKAFISEMESSVALMREDDFDQFYAVADVVMQKYS